MPDTKIRVKLLEYSTTAGHYHARVELEYAGRRAAFALDRSRAAEFRRFIEHALANGVPATGFQGHFEWSER